MKQSGYPMIVEWSDEDRCYVGSCPSLVFGGCCHGDDPKAVFAQLCEIVAEVLQDCKDDDEPLPRSMPPSMVPLFDRLTDQLAHIDGQHDRLADGQKTVGV